MQQQLQFYNSIPNIMQSTQILKKCHLPFSNIQILLRPTKIFVHYFRFHTIQRQFDSICMSSLGTISLLHTRLPMVVVREYNLPTCQKYTTHHILNFQIWCILYHFTSVSRQSIFISIIIIIYPHIYFIIDSNLKLNSISSVVTPSRNLREYILLYLVTFNHGTIKIKQICLKMQIIFKIQSIYSPSIENGMNE